jgi:hypothetical protein
MRPSGGWFINRQRHKNPNRSDRYYLLIRKVGCLFDLVESDGVFGDRTE